MNELAANKAWTCQDFLLIKVNQVCWWVASYGPISSSDSIKYFFCSPSFFHHPPLSLFENIIISPLLAKPSAWHDFFRILIFFFCFLPAFWGQYHQILLNLVRVIKPSVGFSHLRTSTLFSARRSRLLFHQSLPSVREIAWKQILWLSSLKSFKRPPLGMTWKVTFSDEISACASLDVLIKLLVNMYRVKDRSVAPFLHLIFYQWKIKLLT